MSEHKPEPAPVVTDTPEVWPLIIADLKRGMLMDPHAVAVRGPLIDACEARDAFWRSKYGTALQVEKGRHPLRDARDEAMDLMAYTRQHYERLKRKGATRTALLGAWQLHLAACAVATMVVQALEKKP